MHQNSTRFHSVHVAVVENPYTKYYAHGEFLKRMAALKPLLGQTNICDVTSNGSLLPSIT